MKRELYLKAFVTWFLNLMLFWNLLLLPAIVLTAKKGPSAEFVVGYLGVSVLSSIVIAAIIIATVATSKANAPLFYELRWLIAKARKYVWYINPVGLLYAFCVLFAWRTILRPWFAFIAEYGGRMTPH